eukprot:scaffold13021_cov127-Isochrysis_galbana.AAC.4
MIDASSNESRQARRVCSAVCECLGRTRTAVVGAGGGCGGADVRRIGGTCRCALKLSNRRSSASCPRFATRPISSAGTCSTGRTRSQ